MSKKEDLGNSISGLAYRISTTENDINFPQNILAINQLRCHLAVSCLCLYYVNIMYPLSAATLRSKGKKFTYQINITTREQE